MDKFDNRYLDFCKEFVDSLKEVFTTMLGIELQHGQPKIYEKNSTVGDYTGIMGMNGVFSAEDEGLNIAFMGSFFISWPCATYLKVAGAMLGEEFSELSDEIDDVGLEICNITMGGAKKKLNPKGYKIEMSIPNSVKGKGHEIKASKGAVTILVPFSCEIGEFYLGLNYSENE